MFDDPIWSDILSVSTIGSNEEKNHFKYKKRILQISSIFVRIPRYSSWVTDAWFIKECCVQNYGILNSFTMFFVTIKPRLMGYVFFKHIRNTHHAFNFEFIPLIFDELWNDC